MKQNVRVFQRFRGYTVKDYDCRYCLYYGGKKAGCALNRCCCEKERREAAERLSASKSMNDKEVQVFGSQDQS